MLKWMMIWCWPPLYVASTSIKKQGHNIIGMHMVPSESLAMAKEHLRPFDGALRVDRVNPVNGWFDMLHSDGNSRIIWNHQADFHSSSMLEGFILMWIIHSMQAPLPRYARERPSGDFCQVQTGGTGERISQWGWINMKHRHMIEGDYPYIHIYKIIQVYIYIHI